MGGPVRGGVAMEGPVSWGGGAMGVWAVGGPFSWRVSVGGPNRSYERRVIQGCVSWGRVCRRTDAVPVVEGDSVRSQWLGSVI